MQVDNLFKPLPLLHGPAMKNRFMMAPLTSQQSEHDGTASAFDHLWMEQLAQSGYALIQTGAATVEPGGIAFERQMGIHSDIHLPGLTRMATTIVLPEDSLYFDYKRVYATFDSSLFTNV